MGLCPFHAEKTPSFSVNPEIGRYYCFGCQATGDAISFVREVEHLDFVDAVERLAARAGITLRYDDKAVAKDRGRARPAGRRGGGGDRRSTSSCVLDAPEGGTARRYLRSRGFDGDAVRRFRHRVGARRLRPPQRAPAAQGLLARRPRRGRARVREPREQAAGPVPRPAHVPDLRQPGRRGRLRRPRARRRRPQVQELAGDADLPEEPAALRAQLGEGGDRRARRGHHLRGLHRRDGVRARRARRTRSRPAAPRSPTTTSRSSRTSRARWCSRTTPTPRARARPSVGTGGSSASRSRCRSPTSRPGRDPADVWRDDPEALLRAVGSAKPFLEFRIDRVLAAADRDTIEGRARAAELAAGDRGRAPERPRARPVRDEARRRARHRRRPPARGGRARARRRRPGRWPERASDVPARAVRPDRDAPARARAPQPRVDRRELDLLLYAVHDGATGRRLARRAPLRRPDRAAAFEAIASTARRARRDRGADGAVRTLLERVAVEEPIEDAEPQTLRARLMANAVGPAAERVLTSMVRAGDDRASSVKVLLDSLTYARDIGDWEAVQRDAGQLLGWIEEGSRGLGAT